MNIDHSTDTITTDGVGDDVLTISSTGALVLPGGSTGQQPGTPVAGMLRYNTSGYLEYYNSVWARAQDYAAALANVAALAANGLVVLNSSGTAFSRTLTGTSNQITVANGDGVAANPTLSLPSTVTFPGTVTLNADPTVDLHASTKGYVDASTVRRVVRAATTANVATLAGGAPSTLDGVTLAANDRILVKDQTTGSQNGVYYVSTLGTGANGTWTRSVDSDTSAKVLSGLLIHVSEGTANVDSEWTLLTNAAITLGTTSLTFTLSSNNEIRNLAAITGNGVAVRVGSNNWATRTLTAPAAGFTITNPTGVAANPTFVLANDLSALEGLASTGLAVRTATDTWAQRTLTGTSNEITVADGDGVAANPTLSLPSSLTFTSKTITGGTYSPVLINEAQGSNVASSGTVNLNTATGNYVHVTGTTSITAVTLSQGAARTVVFDGALTLTNGASLILPTGANITTAAGDSAVFRGEASSVVRCVVYQRADGTALTGGSAAITVKDEGSNLTTSVSSIDFVGAGVTATNVGAVVTVTINGNVTTISVTASEALTAGDFVALYSNSGTLNVKKASAASGGSDAEGYVLSNVSNGGTATVYVGGINTAVSGLTVGVLYLSSTTSGGSTSTAPTTSGQRIQQLGIALTSTTMLFTRMLAITI